MSPVEDLMKQCEDKMKKTVAECNHELSNIRTGKPNPGLLDKIQVDYYGAPTPLKQIGSISSPDGQSLMIQPFDKTVLGAIEKAILKSDLGLTPNNDANVIRINFPPLTAERRKELSKLAKKFGEDCKIAIRNVRRDTTDTIKKLKKTDSLPEDVVKDKTEEVQRLTDKYITEIDKIVTEKEKEILD